MGVKKKKVKRSRHYEKPLKINTSFDEAMKLLVSEDEPEKYEQGGQIGVQKVKKKK